MPLQIAVSQPNGSVTEHVLFEGRQYRIGRAHSADIVIAHPQISRLHAELQATNDHLWQLNDTSSTGCFSGGMPVKNIAINKPQHLFFGPISCQLTPVEHNKVIQLDSQRVWRERQLKRYQHQLQNCNDSSALVHIARECLIQSLACERASLILFDEENRALFGLGYEPWMNAENFTGSRTIIQRTMETNSVLAVGNIVADDSLNAQRSIIRNGIQAAISVPVCIDDKPIGVLYADSLVGRRYFTDTDIEFAKSLANLLSLRLLFHAIEHKLSLIN
ncbi:GAF domain-containing protein [Alteromonas stellipolaris]|uniref:GAF domain-containing protein n=1 Tax=Alteromonas stellipolaris TaxID=233316 RepID=UPI002736F765|nr:GAF domain-containing protein [Alteromonas stellipolaris]MDP2537956.1 FHA domain-containing protein [Alteromonas stellipolaris]